mgnify:FL=1
MVTLSEKASAVSALNAELDSLERQQLRVGSMQALLNTKQAVLSAKYNGIQDALKKLLK